MLNVIARWCHNVAPRNSAVDDCTCGFRHMTSRLPTGSTVRHKIPDTQTVPCGQCDVAVDLPELWID